MVSLHTCVLLTGSAFDAFHNGLILTVTDVSEADQAGIDRAYAAAGALDATTVAQQPSRYYNFLNCYGNRTSTELYDMYYGPDVSARLVDIKTQADPRNILKAWCDI